MFETILLLIMLLFIAIDVLLGLHRGLVPALVRLGSIILCVAFSFVISSTVSGPLTEALLKAPIPFFDGQTLQEAYTSFLLSHEGFSNAVAMSVTIESLIYHLPVVLMKEIVFLLSFFVLRLITFPVCSFFFYKERRRAKKKGEKKGSVSRGTGAAVGLVQGLLCLAVLMVPIFGTTEFCERFESAFQTADNESVVQLTETMHSAITAPVNQSTSTKVMEVVLLRKACVATFHSLSETTILFPGGERTIDYFEYLESMFPALSAALFLSDVDPEHMTDEDYNNLATVLQTSKEHEEIKLIIKDMVNITVGELVDEQIKHSANILVDRFTEKVTSGDKVYSGEELKFEILAIQSTMDVIRTATSEDAFGAFEVVPAEKLINDLIQTEVLYETIIEVAEDPEERATLVQDFKSTDEEKATMKAEIEKYRAESKTAKTPNEYKKVIQMCDALALILGIELA